MFFKPSDVVKITCVIESADPDNPAFGICEDGTTVYIPNKLAVMFSLEPGDLIDAYAVDNHRPEVERQYSARWRAIRIKINERLVVETTDVDKSDFAAVVDAYGLPLNSTKLAELAGVTQQKANNWLSNEHEYGRMAAAKLYVRGDQIRASAVFYARSVGELEKHLR